MSCLRKNLARVVAALLAIGVISIEYFAYDPTSTIRATGSAIDRTSGFLPACALYATTSWTYDDWGVDDRLDVARAQFPTRCWLGDSTDYVTKAWDDNRISIRAAGYEGWLNTGTDGRYLEKLKLILRTKGHRYLSPHTDLIGFMSRIGWIFHIRGRSDEISDILHETGTSDIVNQKIRNLIPTKDYVP